jgi:ankyrin repeat protein
MDIKKFIASNKIDNDYNKMIHLELDSIKHKGARQTSLQNEDTTIKNDNNNFKCLYKMSECDFFAPNISIKQMFNDPNIIEFEKKYIDDRYIKHLAYSGPMIKRYIDPTKMNLAVKENITQPPVCNQYIVTLIDNREKPKNILKDNVKADIITTTPEKNDSRTSDGSIFLGGVVSSLGYYVIKINQSTFFLNKKTFTTLSSAVLSNTDNLNRIALYQDDLWISGMFILELYRRISCYDPSSIDPMFGYPEDILDIYDRFNNKNKLKNILDMVMHDNLQQLSKDEIETTLITHEGQKYTVIEYMLLCMMENNIHSVVSYQMKLMVIYLLQYQYLRPAFFFARLIGFDKKYPAMYENIIEIINTMDIDPRTCNTSCLISVYHIDMYILNHLIKSDSCDQFIEYVFKSGIASKFKLQSKTIEKLIDWMIDYRAIKIINTVIDGKIISDQHKYKIILLTQEFTLLGKDFILKYLVKKSSTIDQKKSIQIDQSTDQLTVKSANQLDVDEQSTNELSISHQQMILNVLPDVMNRGITRSFYMILKLCPYIIEPNFIKDTNLFKNNSGNILHMISTDDSVDILEIILKKNISLIDVKDDDEKTPLILYSELGLHQCVVKILSMGCDYELTDNLSDTFLHKICQNGRLDILQSVIRNVIDIIDVKNDKMMTPALVATYYQHEEIFYVLKGLCADLDAVDFFGNSVYHYICKSKLCPGILVTNKKNKFGFTPYDYCTIDHKFYYFQSVQ